MKRGDTDFQGEINAPNRVMFFAYRSGAQSTDSGWDDFDCDTEVFDNGGNYDTANGKFTAPEDGVYLFISYVQWASIADGSSLALEFRVNGGTSGGARVYKGFAAGTGNYQIGGAAFLELSTNDFVEPWVYQSDGNGETLNVGNDPYYTYFQGIKIA